jgi:hypothetical protein
LTQIGTITKPRTQNGNYKTISILPTDVPQYSTPTLM